MNKSKIMKKLVSLLLVRGLFLQLYCKFPASLRKNKARRDQNGLILVVSRRRYCNTPVNRYYGIKQIGIFSNQEAASCCFLPNKKML